MSAVSDGMNPCWRRPSIGSAPDAFEISMMRSASMPRLMRLSNDEGSAPALSASCLMLIPVNLRTHSVFSLGFMVITVVEYGLCGHICGGIESTP